MKLKSRAQVLQERLGSVNESVFKIGDVYKVKTLVEVPKSIINAFVSKAKKEQDVDPREMWSDTDLAEIFVNYVTSTFLNIDSIPVDAIMGEKSPEVQAQGQPAPPITEPVQTPPVQDTQTPPIQGTVQIEN